MLTLDALDRGLIHALHLDGRVPFRKVADVLGTSTQTVARRYGRLRADAGVRVVGLTPHRQQWMVRLTATAATAQEVARALARRSDTSWVRLTSGGTEIVAIIRTTVGGTDPHALLLRDIPRTTSITSVSAHYLLHMYLGGPTAWHGRVRALTAEQQDRLRPPTPGGEPLPLTDRDHVLLDALARDGRTSYTDLAAVTGWSSSTVTRRLDDLCRTGAVFFDVEVDDALFGITASALLWMSVAPAHLQRVGLALAGHPELAVVAATTGSTNLMAHALCTDLEALHEYLTTRLAIDAIRSIETAPVLRTVKGVGPVRGQFPP